MIYEEMETFIGILRQKVGVEQERKIRKAEQTISEILKRESKNGILHVTLDEFVRKEVIPLTKNKESLPVFKDKVWSAAVKELRRDHEVRINEVYGKNRQEVSFRACGHKEAALEKWAEQELKNHLSSIKEEYEKVNEYLMALSDARQRVHSSSLPVYEDKNREDFRRILDFYASDISRLMSGILPFNVEEPDYRINIVESGTKYKGKSSGVHQFTVSRKFRQEPKLYRKPNHDDRLQNLVSYIENCPTAAKNDRTVSVPSRAPEILAVDLLHECGHMIANEIVERSNGSPKANYESGDLSPVGQKEVNIEKAANEVALFSITAISSNADIYKPVQKGFHAYLNLTRYDNPAEGYQGQGQGQIDGNRQSIKNMLL